MQESTETGAKTKETLGYLQYIKKSIILYRMVFNYISLYYIIKQV